jgi:PadR family transcriptional regulator, regulatory protein PadR
MRPNRLTPALKRGSAAVAILSVLAEGRLHGYEIARRIEETTDGVLHFTLASLYPMLYTMERRGWIEGRWERAPSGRQRRCYRLTRSGRRQLVSAAEEWRTFFAALHRLTEVARA